MQWLILVAVLLLAAVAPHLLAPGALADTVQLLAGPVGVLGGLLVRLKP